LAETRIAAWPSFVVAEFEMNDVLVQLGKGWREDAPANVREILRHHEGNGKSGILEIRAGAHLKQFERTPMYVFYEHGREQEGIRATIECIGSFLAELERNDHDVVSLIFINFKAAIGFEKQLTTKSDFQLVTEGLRAFCTAVMGSFAVVSTCEWAMLSCSLVG